MYLRSGASWHRDSSPHLPRCLDHPGPADVADGRSQRCSWRIWIWTIQNWMEHWVLTKHTFTIYTVYIYIYIIVFFLGYVWSREMSFLAVADVVSVASSSWTSNERRVSWSILLWAHCPELNAQIAKFQYYYDLLWTSMNNKKQQSSEQTKQQKLMHGWRNRSTCLFRKGSRPKNGERFHCKRKFMDPSPYFWALAMSNIVVGYIRIRSGHILPTLSRDSHFGQVYPCDLFSNSFEPKKLPRLFKYP